MDALIKASLYIGTILLVGAGVYSFFISRSRTQALLIYAGLGYFLLSLASVTHLSKQCLTF